MSNNGIIRTMRGAVATLVCALFILVQGSVSSSALSGLEPGMEAPEFNLADLSGARQHFGRLKGEKLTIVLFWATWGENSTKALTMMQSLHQRYAGKGLSVVGINVDRQEMTAETVRAIRARVADLKITFPILLDQGLGVFHAFGVVAVPSTVVLDSGRVLRYELSGFPLVGADGLRRRVEAAVEGKDGARHAEIPANQPDKRAIRFLHMGRASQKSERTADRAQGWFEKAIAADPAFVQPYIALGELLYQHKRYEEARKQYQAAVQQQPTNPVALCGLGQVALAEGKNAEAEAWFDKVLATDSSYLPAYYLLGLVKGKQGDMKRALELFETGERMNPQEYRLFFHKGLMYEVRGDLVSAAQAYKWALELMVGRR